MHIINLRDIPESASASPKGTYASSVKDVSVALGRHPESLDLLKRHPFDVQICTIPPGKARCPYHAHSAQWEYFQVLAGSGAVRHHSGITPIELGDTFLCRPDEPHQLLNNGTEPLVLIIVADNPLGESCYYPDSKKWSIEGPRHRIVRSEPVDYFEGEE